MASLLGFGRQADYREAQTEIPQKPVALPYELRNEMTWMDFSHPVNPLGSPKSMVQSMHSALVDGELSFAPDRDGHVLRSTIARMLGLEEGCVLTGASALSMIRTASQAFQVGVVGVVAPAPPEYALAVENAGHECVELINPVSFATVDAYTARIEVGDLDGAILGNPTYPSSRLLARSTLIHYLETCNWVIVDESNIELSFGGESAVPLIEQYPNLVVVRSPSTTFGMPGVPVSYLVADPGTVRQIRQFYDGSDITMFGEVLAKEFAAQQSFLEDTHEFLDKEIPWMQCMLSLVPGISIYPAEGNFVLCEFFPDKGLRLGVTCTEELVVRLQLAGFLVRALPNTPGLPSNEYFSVSVRMRDENQKLLDALKSIIG